MEQKRKGCLMITFKIPNWKKMVDKLIDDKDVYDNDEKEFGKEYNPHLTLIWGFDNTINHEMVKQYLMPTHYIKVYFYEIDAFKNDEYDVLKINCKSRALDSMNKALAHYFPDNLEQTYPDYKPHMTISYLKPGLSKKYLKKLSKPFTLVPEKYKYSYADGQTEYFDIDVFPGSEDNTVIK